MPIDLRPCRPRTLGLALLAVALLPWLLGEVAKTFYQPGLDNDALRHQLLIDYLVIGTAIFGLSMVSTLAVGCWVVATLKGPRFEADSFPVDGPRRAEAESPAEGDGPRPGTHGPR